MQDDIYCIDPCCQVGNLYANTGHGSKGWTYSWGSAVLLAKVETKQEYCSQIKIFCADCVRGKYRKYQPGELWSQKIPSAEKMDWKLRKMFRLLFRCLWAVLSSVPHHHVKYTSGESHFWSFDIKCWIRGHQDPGDIRLNRISFGLRTKGAERLTEGRQNGKCTYNLSNNCSQTDSIRYNIYSKEDSP